MAKKSADKVLSQAERYAVMQVFLEAGKAEEGFAFNDAVQHEAIAPHLDEHQMEVRRHLRSLVDIGALFAFGKARNTRYKTTALGGKILEHYQ